MAIPVNDLWPNISRTRFLKARKIVRQAVGLVLKREKSKAGLVCVSLVGPTQIKKLNQAFRHKNKATDVLSFPMGEPKILGDVIICWPVAVKQAKQLGHTLAHELVWLATHGTLHLLGYDHQTAPEKKIMENKSAEILAALKI